MKTRNPFLAHPSSVGESYFEHLVAASGFSARMFYGAVVCLVHALLPFLFVTTGSRLITGLHDRMVSNRVRHAARQQAVSRTAG